MLFQLTKNKLLINLDQNKSRNLFNFENYFIFNEEFNIRSLTLKIIPIEPLKVAVIESLVISNYFFNMVLDLNNYKRARNIISLKYIILVQKKKNNFKSKLKNEC